MGIVIMVIFKKIFLKPGREASLLRFHPWIFSGAVSHVNALPGEGEIVEVFSSAGEYLATGHFMPGSLAVKVFSFQRVVPDQVYWESRLEEALRLRKALGLAGNTETSAYRLVSTEGDGLPGLIIDIFGDAAVIQAQSAGMHFIREQLAAALKSLYGESLQTIYDKSSEGLRRNSGLRVKDGWLLGNAKSTIITEHGHRFHVDWVRGQKTGFFADQRENRELLGHYSRGKKVLNLYGYTGGFSVYALKAGATCVHTVDTSKEAMELCADNLVLNGFDPAIHECRTEDAMRFLDSMDDSYDLIILDPPAFAKHLEQKNQAAWGYKHINLRALQKIRKGGILFTFSCSQAVSRSFFNSTVASAAIESGRTVRILHQLSQPADHPLSLFHPEGEYLKGLVLQVD